VSNEPRKDDAMRVRDLIALLEKFPPDTRVLTRGYEGGMDGVTVVKLVETAHSPDESWYYGDYLDYALEDRETFPAIYLGDQP
jgi:hypothetical protein